MSRQHRPWYKGAIYHTFSRGNRRGDLFLDDADRQKYFSLLLETRKLYPYTLHSYCLMTNHTHLLIETDQHHIGLIMKNINFRYAIYFNKKYNLEGHVFQGRYGSALIESAAKFLNTTRYIHLNPVEANITKNPEDYKWSSYNSYITNTPNELISKNKTLSLFMKPKIENLKKFTIEKE
ncbi:transposase [Metabacillus litoralis]|uniref:Transposase n=1 Tax=Metabacillus litoralis TaxID=152268 RepID=A0A5C6VLY1_9BACI|nr:transposase [Metabacillus litoralis]TXC85949.1 transposase [Metabacillus litoralis]